jgi:hypothetical protein
VIGQVGLISQRGWICLLFGGGGAPTTTTALKRSRDEEKQQIMMDLRAFRCKFGILKGRKLSWS